MFQTNEDPPVRYCTAYCVLFLKIYLLASSLQTSIYHKLSLYLTRSDENYFKIQSLRPPCPFKMKTL